MQNSDPVRISAVIKTRNEEKNISDCLHSLKGFVDEVIVIDDASTDATKSIALELGARVIEARRGSDPIDTLDIIGWKAALGNWLLTIDADERMTPDLAFKLKEVAQNGKYSGVRFARKNIMFGKIVYHGGWFLANQLRFIRSDAWDREWEAEIHSFPPLSGVVLTLPARKELSTLHYDYESVEQYIERTLLHYSKAEAVILKRRGIKFSLMRLFLRPPKVFLGRLIIRSGWRDGVRGVILAGLLACYAFLIEAILWDLWRTEE